MLPTDYPSLLTSWLVAGSARMSLNAHGKLGSGTLASKLPALANLVITNVPGAPVPLCLVGAKFLSFHPLSIIMPGLGLNITVQTYAGHVDCGIVADKKPCPHANDLARAIEAAFAEAHALPNPASGKVTNAAKSPSKRFKLEVSLLEKPSKMPPRRDTQFKSNSA